MTTIEMSNEGFVTSRADWLDSVSSQVDVSSDVFTKFKSWATKLVCGVDAPTEATYTRFENQACQVAFANTILPIEDVRRSPLGN